VSAQPLLIARNDFRVGYTAQQEWAWLITAAFLFGSVGAGLYVVSYFAGFSEGALAGLLVVGVLKSVAHVLFLGKPLRAWRAVFRWRTSWISRGLIAIGVFLACGLVYLLPYLGVSSLAGSAVKHVFGVIAVGAALVVMVYDGFVMKSARGIPLWNTYLVPLLVFCYALIGGTTLALVLRVSTGEGFSTAGIEGIGIGMLGLNIVLVALYVFTIRGRGGAAELAVRLLMRGRLKIAFLLAALVVGLGAALVLAAVAAVTGSTPVLAIAAGADLAGHFAMFFALLRAGVYAPPRPLPAPA
jgi:formate-dependent nitrite reductase membrane component NrfD